MGRKRVKKEAIDGEVKTIKTKKSSKTIKTTKSSKFKCSECNDGFNTEDEINCHIFNEHYGLARINDEMKTPFTESEIIKALIKAQKVMKVLKCKNNGCDKTFRSGLGLKMHWDLCGKSESEITTKCEICGKQLKISSILCHMRIHSKPIVSNESETELEDDSSDHKTDNRGPKRASAIRAKKTLKKRRKEELIISGSVSDSEFKSGDASEDGSDTEEEYEPIVEEEEPIVKETVTPIKQNSEQNFKKILGIWTEFVVSVKDSLRKLPENNWVKEIQAKGKVMCPLKDCQQVFSTRDGLKYHYQRCGIQFKFLWKCKVCGFEAMKGNKAIVLHLWSTHKKSLPTLPSELSQYIGSVTETNEQMPKSVRERADTKRVGTFTTLLEFHERFYKQKSFPRLVPTINSWIPVTEDEYSTYIPNPTPSPHFKTTLSASNSWIRLNLFESLSTENHINFFVGGSVWSSAWCPIPFNVNVCDQYVAIASNMNPETAHTLNDTGIESGLIQIWNLGKLNKEFDLSVKPRLALSIAHWCGMVWDMEWCPGGTTWDDITSFKELDRQVLPRLGLLAIACGDGFIRIHSIPHPQSLNVSNDKTLYNNEPLVILNPPGVGNSVNCENTVCKCLSWIKSNDQHLMLGGYGSGVIAVWDLTTSSSLLIVEQNANQTILRPLQSWIGHSAAVNRIKWVDNSSDQFLVSCSFDRTAKLWNLKDLTVPITTIRKGLFTSIDTHIKWNGIFMANDDCYLGFQNNVTFKDFGFFNFGALCLSSHKSCIWDLSVSEWTSAVVSVDAAGEAVIYPNFQLRSETKRKAYDRIPLYHISVLPLNNAIIPSQEVSTKAKNTKKKKSVKQNDNNFDLVIDREEPPLRSYLDFSCKYGLVFNDYNSSDLKAIPLDEINRIRMSANMQYQRLSDYPFISINRVCWNPNLMSCTWILTATQSGICRLSCSAFLNPTQNKSNSN